MRTKAIPERHWFVRGCHPCGCLLALPTAVRIRRHRGVAKALRRRDESRRRRPLAGGGRATWEACRGSHGWRVHVRRARGSWRSRRTRRAAAKVRSAVVEVSGWGAIVTALARRGPGGESGRRRRKTNRASWGPIEVRLRTTTAAHDRRPAVRRAKARRRNTYWLPHRW